MRRETCSRQSRVNPTCRNCKAVPFKIGPGLQRLLNESYERHNKDGLPSGWNQGFTDCRSVTDSGEQKVFYDVLTLARIGDRIVLTAQGPPSLQTIKDPSQLDCAAKKVLKTECALTLGIAYTHTYRQIGRRAHMYTYIQTYTFAHILTFIPTYPYMHTCTLARMPSIHPSIHASMHPCMLAYILTPGYVLTYIHTFLLTSAKLRTRLFHTHRRRLRMSNPHRRVPNFVNPYITLPAPAWSDVSAMSPAPYGVSV